MPVNFAEQLLEVLDFITEFEREKYQVYSPDDLVVDMITNKAALINGYWVARSCMRTDEDKIYIKDWIKI